MTNLAEFDYILPSELIARYPCACRDASRLLVLDRTSGQIRQTIFSALGDFLTGSEVLVLNDTKVIPARIFCRRKSGGAVEIFVHEIIDDHSCRVLVRPKARIKDNESLVLPDRSEVVIAHAGKDRIAMFSNPQPLPEILAKIGTMPLPPYIDRATEPSDTERYQTVYARREGASAAPTAGLHFTDELLTSLKKKGVEIVSVTLHTSYGTFAPIKSEQIESHTMHREWYELTSEAAEVINRAKESGRRVIAVGTTSVRVLESCLRGNRVVPASGWTDIFLYPPYQIRSVDGLITNFHLPKSTLLLLVSAFAGTESILSAYHYAVEKEFRFFSYGDAMLIR